MSCTIIIREVHQSSEMEMDLEKSKKVTSPTSEKIVSLVKTHGHLLLVEDNELSRKIFLKVLDNLGFTGETSVAKDGEEAVKLFKEHQETISIIFMDIIMPIKNGIDATKEIRELEKGNTHVPIICISLGSDKTDNGWSEAGMDAGMGKAFTMENILEALQTHHKYDG